MNSVDKIFEGELDRSIMTIFILAMVSLSVVSTLLLGWWQNIILGFHIGSLITFIIFLLSFLIREDNLMVEQIGLVVLEEK